MSLPELLTLLNQKGIKLWADQSKLRLTAPKGALTDELKRAIATHKPALLNHLTQKNAATLTPSGLTLETIGQLIGGSQDAFPVINPQIMASQLQVTFRPLPSSGQPSDTVLKLRTDLENSLTTQGVIVVPWEKATREFSYPLPFIGKFLPQKQLSTRVVKSSISAVIDVERPINKLKSGIAEKLYQLTRKFSSRSATIAEITRQIAWAEDHAIQRLEDPTATQVILLTELDNAFVDAQLPYTEKITLGVNTLISQFAEVIIGVSSTRLSILNMNLSDSFFSREHLDTFVARSLIPKIYVPIAPLPLSRFTSGHYEPTASPYAHKLVTLSQALAKTNLLPSGFQLAEVVKRQSHQDIVSAIVNGRSGVSYGFVAYAEPPAYEGPIEISQADWQALDPVCGYTEQDIRQTSAGRQYLKTTVDEQTYYKQIPDIWLVCSRSGANKTNLDINKDILRLGIQGGLNLQVAEGIDLADSQTDIKPSYDTYVMVAIALAAALYTPELINNGAPIIHFHGYPAKTWFQPAEDHAGTQNPAVPCGTYESGVFNFLSLHQLANSAQRPLTLVGLVEPDHGINLLAQNLDHLLARIQDGTEKGLVTLEGQHLPSLRPCLKNKHQQNSQSLDNSFREDLEKSFSGPDAVTNTAPAQTGGME